MLTMDETRFFIADASLPAGRRDQMIIYACNNAQNKRRSSNKKTGLVLPEN